MHKLFSDINNLIFFLMQEVYLCALFDNNTLTELKNFFIHFKRANPRIKKAYFRIT